MGGRSIQVVKFGDQELYVEVSDVEQQGVTAEKDDPYEEVSTQSKVREAGSQVEDTIKALSETVQSALKGAQPQE